ILSIESVAEIRSQLKPANGSVPGFGLRYFDGGKIWLYTKIPVLAGNEDHLVLRIKDSRVREARLAVIRNGTVRSQTWRYDDALRQAGLSNRWPTFAFDRAEIEGADILVGFNSLGALRANVILTTERAARMTEGRQGFSAGLLEGILAALSLYLLVLGWRMREPSLLFASGLLFFTGWFSLGVSGHAHALLLPAHPVLADVLLYGGQPVPLTFWLLLVVSYLGVLKRNPVLGFILVVLAALLPFQGILTLFTALGYPLPFITDNATSVLLGLISGFGTTIYYAVRGERRALRLLLCFLPIALWSLARTFLYFHPSPDHNIAAIFESYADVPVTMVLLALLVSVDLQARERWLRRMAEENEALFRHYAEIATDSYFETDARGNISRVAGSVALSHGFVPGQSLAALVPDARPFLSGGAAKVGTRDLELKLEDDAGQVRWLAIDLFPKEEVTEPDEAGWRGTVSDVTERVERRRREGRQSTLLALGQLASGVAHEVNNLLHPMINLAQRVRDRHTVDPEARKLLDLVVDSGRHAGEIVAGVLNAFNPSRDIGRIAGLAEATEQAIAAIRPTLPSSVNLRSSIDKNVTIPAVAGEVLQILSNLTSNAVRATDGHGKIDIRLAAHDDGGAELVFADDGPGLPDSLLPHATEPFVSGREDGTGLGLAIVAGIVQKWGGTLAITHAEPHGAVFIITLPAAADEDNRMEPKQDLA
ncbi:MAG: hypothetical protein RLZZ444_1366, partial [Pseudomonadota bacterium]